MDTLRLFLFGSPRIEINNQPVTLRRRKVVALFIYLAVTRQTQERDLLATLFWPESSQKAARSALRRELHALQRALGSHWFETTRNTIAIAPDQSVWLDSEAFRQHLESTSSHIHDEGEQCTHCLNHLENALALYTDDFLSGFTLTDTPQFDEWQFFETEQLRRSLATSLSQIVALQPNAESAIPHAQRLVAFDPLDEASQRTLMRLYAQSGQLRMASRQFEQCQQLLATELGVDPEAETIALHEAIQRRQLPQQKKNRPAPAPPSHNLPEQRTPFVGREGELAVLKTLLSEPDCRLLTLVGQGGMGKSRLALTCATALLSNYSDGVYWVQLDSVTTTSGIITAIAEAVGLQFYENERPQQQLFDYLRSKRLLLILDAFEHLSECATLLSHLLMNVRQVQLLVTSRLTLNLMEEWVHALGGMTLPTADQVDLAELIKSDAVRLFVQSARRVRHDFALIGQDQAVLRVCRLVEGMPLALELAAAWLSVMPCDQIAADIERNLDILTARFRNIPPRHQTVRAVMEQSWQLLTGREQVILQKLSLFRDGFERDSAESVTGATLFTLLTLVEKSLLQTNAHGRYTMHGLLRQFASEKLSVNPDSANSAGQRHATHFLDLLQRQIKQFFQTTDPATLAKIDIEFRNIITGWEWSVANGEISLLSPAITPLYEYLEVRYRYEEGHTLFTSALDRFDCQDQALYRQLSARLGACYHALDEFELSEKHAKNALNFPEQDEVRAFALTVLGTTLQHWGELETGEIHFEEALLLYEAANDTWGTADTLCWLADSANWQGQWHRAKDFATRSLTFGRKVGYPQLIARALYSRAFASSLSGDYEAAQRDWHETLQTYEQIGSQFGRALALGGLGLTATDIGGSQLQAAIDYQQQALEINRRLGNRQQIAVTLGDLARVYNETGAFAQAQLMCREGLVLAEEIQSIALLWYHQYHLGLATCRLGDLQTGQHYLRSSLKSAWQGQSNVKALRSIFQIGRFTLQKDTQTQDQTIQAIALLQFVAEHPDTMPNLRERALKVTVGFSAEPQGGLPHLIDKAKKISDHLTLDEVVTWCM